MEDYPLNLLNPARLYQPSFHATSMESSFKLDEGYSEEVRSQDGSESSMRLGSRTGDMLEGANPVVAELANGLLALNEADRSEFAYNVIRTLRTSSIAAIVDRLRPILHRDPVNVLPTEITSQIFSYLAPSTLLRASIASQAWRQRCYDSQLWKQKFTSEGWGLEMDEVRRFEQNYRYSSGPLPQKSRSRRAETNSEQNRRRKRARAGGDARVDTASRRSLQGHSMAQDERQGTPESELASTVTQDFSHDEEMQDVDSFLVATNTPRRRESFDPVALQAPSRFQYSTMHIDENMMTSDTRVLNPASKTGSPISMSEKFVAEPPLVLPTSSGSPRLNFPHVYKQRRKLEDNWDAGRYKPFQLPHRDYAEEAHSECVYTIQHMGNYLVSGSRDRSLRIWDLDSQRLARKPLLGHTGSVLCLQFDASEKEDIIISGSSDTDVILWRFSTGKMIQKIGQAHRESVLNLKFDERFLVTCSKDKTIKIWNRQELRPGDRDYPVKGIQSGGRCPAYIVDLRNFGGPRDIEDHLTPEQKEPLQPYTTLMILDSHGAAVNAIHIQNDQLVSASGDRNLKVWDIHTGVCTAVCRGHMKGIACVQYDGKRIVSGSSDNTIRIFDPISTAEVACLKGHTKLVRTVQSAFGDLPGSREQLELDASAVDRDYYEARRLGKLATTSERTRERNAGSRQPKDIMALGAKIPPGGGGSRWGRIVSGSYDETIIVWKKALDESTWVIAHRLRQGEALQAAGPPLLAHSDRQPPAMPPAWAGWQRFISARAGVLGPAQPFQPQPQPQTTAGPSTQAPMPATQIVQHAMQTGAAALQTGMQNIASINAHLTNTPAGSNTPPFNTLPAHLQASMQQIHSQQQVYLQQLAQQQTQQRQLAAPNQQVPQPTNHPPPPPPVQAPPPLPTIQQIAPHAPQAFPPHPNLALAANTATAAPIGPQPNARVFKLQFDARRIICCSQDPKIVGWDFANDDEEIVACSRFFAQPQ